jgi:glycerate-2-kinase
VFPVKNCRTSGSLKSGIGGGETTVKIDGRAGEGGPNQEFSFGAAPGLNRIGNVVIVGLDSDGTDGPTDITGGIVDN